MIKNYPEEVKKAIRETLVIENKQSVDIAVKKIMDLMKQCSCEFSYYKEDYSWVARENKHPPVFCEEIFDLFISDYPSF